MQLNTVSFTLAKRGNEEWEWEDGAAVDPGDPAAGRPPRIAVADGATTGFGSARWATQLVTGFVVDRPGLGPEAVRGWLRTEQARWIQDPHWAGADGIALRKLHRVGTLATFLGCELSGLEVGRPRWDAFALGDTVLFHVRDHALVQQFPPIPPDGFGFTPDGLPTRPDDLDGMLAGYVTGGGDIAAGDLLFVATDALAEWMVTADLHRPRALWELLAGIDHPDTFAALVAERRRLREMKNDDVTLTRVHLTTEAPEHLVVCL